VLLTCRSLEGACDGERGASTESLASGSHTKSVSGKDLRECGDHAALRSSAPL